MLSCRNFHEKKKILRKYYVTECVPMFSIPLLNAYVGERHVAVYDNVFKEANIIQALSMNDSLFSCQETQQTYLGLRLENVPRTSSSSERKIRGKKAKKKKKI